MRRKPVNPDAAQAEGVDYLLREFSALRTTAPAAGTVADASKGGPIEPTYLIAAYNARDEIRAVADFVCDGTDDQEEFAAALAILRAKHVADSEYGGGCLQLSSGTFFMSDTLKTGFTPYIGRITMRGVGQDATIITSANVAPSYGDSLVSLTTEQVIADMTIETRHAGWEYAISVFGTDIDNPGIIQDCTVRNNYSNANPNHGAINLGQYCAAINCTVEHDIADTGGYAAIFATGPASRVMSCTVVGSGASGIEFYNSDDIFCVNNYVQDCTEHGIYFHLLSDGGTIIGNIVDTATIDGDDILIAGDNVVYGGNIGTVVDTGSGNVTFDNSGVTAADVSPLTTKGDLWGYDTADNRVGIGANGTRLTPDSGEATGLRWDTPASAMLYVSSASATTIGSSSTPVKVAGTTTLETTPAAVGFTMPANNRLTYTGTATKKFLVTATITAETAVSAPNQLLGFHIAEGGTVNAHTTIQRFVVTAQQKGAIAIQGMFELATNDYVEAWISNETAGNNATVTHMVLTAIEVP